MTSAMATAAEQYLAIVRSQLLAEGFSLLPSPAPDIFVAYRRQFELHVMSTCHRFAVITYRPQMARPEFDAFCDQAFDYCQVVRGGSWLGRVLFRSANIYAVAVVDSASWDLIQDANDGRSLRAAGVLRKVVRDLSAGRTYSLAGTPVAGWAFASFNRESIGRLFG